MRVPSQPSDAITAFAVPNPSCSSQGSWFFRVWWLDELPRQVDHPAYFGSATFYFRQPFQPSTLATLSPAEIGNAVTCVTNLT